MLIKFLVEELLVILFKKRIIHKYTIEILKFLDLEINSISNYIDSIKPDLLILPSCSYDTELGTLYKGSKRINSKLLLLIDNWDNLSSKSTLIYKPNYLGVWGNQTKKHAIEIHDINKENIERKFKEGMKVAVVAGFQGISSENRITTLGRGGSDTTAVAISATFGAERCDIFTDVEGVFTTDPRIVKNARKLDVIAYEEMLELSSLGAKVLHTRSVELAMRYGVRLQVLSSFEEKNGTLVCREDKMLESKIISGISCSKEEAKITLTGVDDKPGVAAAIFGPLSESGINVDMIIQNISENNSTDLTFSCPSSQVLEAEEAIKVASKKNEISFKTHIIDTNVAKVSLVGIGMRSHTGIAKKMFEALASENINILVISTSEIKISILVEQKYMELAVQTLHDAFELEKP